MFIIVVVVLSVSKATLIMGTKLHRCYISFSLVHARNVREKKSTITKKRVQLCYSFGTLGVGLRKYCSQKLHYSFGTQALSWSVPWASLLAKCGATTEDGSCWVLLLHQNVLMLFATFLDRCAGVRKCSSVRKNRKHSKVFQNSPGFKVYSKALDSLKDTPDTRKTQ